LLLNIQKRFWDIRYEPRAICWMLVPETLKGLWNQRVRWAQGGIEVIIRHFNIFKDFRQRRLYPIYLEQILSILWAIGWLVTTILLVINMVITKNFYVPIYWTGSYLTLICLIQFLIAIIMDRKYDENFIKYYLWAVWYPIFYWYFNALVVIRALPKAIFKKKNKYAVWDSPDRGI